MSVSRPLALTLGDPAGIGPEIIAAAFRDAPHLTRGCFVVGDLDCMRRGARAVAQGRPSLPVALIESPADTAGVPPRCVPLLQAVPRQPLPPIGQVSAAGGRIAADCVIWGARAALRGEVAALVTAPLNKEALAAAGVAFPGHTELLQAEAAAWLGKPL